MRIRIQLFISEKIRIQGAKTVRILIRIQILVRILSPKQINFYMKNTFKLGTVRYRTSSKTYLKSLFESTRFICEFWSIAMLLDLDPDPHS